MTELKEIVGDLDILIKRMKDWGWDNPRKKK